jgi:hypothetical protein
MRRWLALGFEWSVRIFRSVGLSLNVLPSEQAQIKVDQIQAMTGRLVSEYLSAQDTTSIVVFSKDRPPQLDLLIRSILTFVKGFHSLTILYRSSDQEMSDAYNRLFAQFDEERRIRIVSESNFKSDLMLILKELPSRHVMFLVDDIVFRRSINLEEVVKDYWPWSSIFSPRLGLNTVWCYTKNRPQRIPQFSSFGENKCVWRWENGEHDFAYPLSLDGHLFSTSEIRALFSLIEFKAPNSLEKSLQVFLPLFRSRLGQCHEESIIVNIPANRVQDEIPNRAESESGGRDLIDYWQLGKRISLSEVVSILPKGAHHPIPYTWE